MTVAVVIGTIAAPGVAGVIEDAISRAAGDLVLDQRQAGDWHEAGYQGAVFTGESVVGLADAYQLTGQADYKTAAESGGDYCLLNAGYDSETGEYDLGFYACGAYAMTRLSEISGTPADNTWRTALEYFYYPLTDTGSTQWYVDTFVPNGSTGVYDLARHTVAASYTGATDVEIYRSGLIRSLALINDGDGAPVMGLGVAVWSLAQTGPMDSTLVDPGAAGGSLWDGVTLGDLPGMLAGQQDVDGSFFTHFDPALGSGYTETTAMGALGLIAADESTYASEILDARLALAGGVDTGGDVYWKIGHKPSGQNYFLAGETLEVLVELLPGDVNGDGWVSETDLSMVISYWGQSGLGRPYGDLNGNGVVDGPDYAEVLSYWHTGTAPGEPAGVPEPATIGLLALGGSALLSHKWKWA